MITTNIITSPIINGTPSGSGLPTLIFLKGDASGDYATSSTSFVKVANSLSRSLTVPTGWKLRITATGNVYVSTAAVQIVFAIFDGGTSLQEMVIIPPSAAASSDCFHLDYVIEGDGGTHYISLMFRTTNAADAANIRNSSSQIPTMILEMTPSN